MRHKTVRLLNGTLLNSTITKQYNYTTTASLNSTSSKKRQSQNSTVSKEYNCSVCPFRDGKFILVLLKTARVFDERLFAKCFAKHFAKYVFLFFKTKGAVSLVSLFREMAHLGEKCLPKQRKTSSFCASMRKTCPIAGTEGRGGD
jgi:hypothetical protein